MSEGEALSPLKKALVALDKLQRRLDAVEGKAHEPIAVIGIGCRTPGGVRDPESLWRLLHDGVDAITEVPKDRWDLDALYDPDRDAPGKMYTRFGGFLDEVDRFDARFFGIAPREAVSMDPQQRLLLETSWEALEHGGQTKERLMGSRTGVYMGICFDEYSQLHLYSPDATRIDAYSFTGTAASVLTGRLSYSLGLQGPSVTVDTACSSSLVTVHLACQALRDGECEMALAGGVNLILSPQNTIYFCKVNALSPDGRCKTFDASANGYVRGEGCGVVVLKRLSDALRDHDPVLALIRGSAINQDGRSNGLTAPNGPSQERVIRDALLSARVKPAQVGYVEAHGTGTPLGDPIEVRALGNVYREGRDRSQPLVVGSVKTNMGHLEGAAGVVGLIKTVLSLGKGEIPPHLHFHEPNPMISLGEIPAEIPTAIRPWNAAPGTRFAGVSSFGISGTNAHVILQDAGGLPAEAPTTTVEGTLHVLPLSAHSPEALAALAGAYRERMTRDDAPALGDLAYSASVRRSHHEYRLAAVARSSDEVVERLDAFLRGERRPGLSSGRKESDDRPKVVFVFPGQGSQWFGMARELREREPVFRDSLARCEEALRRDVGWSLGEQLGLAESSPDYQLNRIDVIQPTLFSIQVSLAALWRSWDIVPDAVVGHSMGEVAATHVAGALSLEDAARIICRRSLLLRRTSGKGAMAVVELSFADAEAALRGYEGRLSIAVSNSSRSTVLSGDTAALDELLARLDGQGVFCRRIKVDVASHSPQMDPLREDLLAALQGIAPRASTVPVYSTVRGAVVEGTTLDARYWVDNLRQPVRFSDMTRLLHEDGHEVFLELSPHPILLPAIQEELLGRERPAAALASMRREEGEQFVLLESLSALYTQGYPVEWERLHAAGGRLVSLPAYPWQREHFWLDAPKSRGARPAGSHPLLGEHRQSSVDPDSHSWELDLDLERLPSLRDHRVRGQAVLPAAAYAEIALAAAREALGPGPHVVEALRFEQALFVPDDAPPHVQVVLTADGSGAASFRLASQGEGKWTRHAAGSVRAGGADATAPPAESPEAIRGRCRTALTDHAARMKARGLDYGPAFAAIAELWRGTGETLARLQPPESVARELAGYSIHPALLDAGFQAFLSGAATARGTYLPVALGSLTVYRPGTAVSWAQAVDRVVTDEGLEGDVRLLDSEGQVVAEARGLRLERVGAAAVASWYHSTAWTEAPLEGAAAASPIRWLVLADGGGVGQRLASRLTAAGDTCTIVRQGTEFRSAAGAYEVDASRAEDFARVLKEAWPGPSREPSRIAHLWSLDAPATTETSLADLGAAQVSGTGSALALTQALLRAEIAPDRLFLVTRGVQMIGDRPRPLSVAQAPLWGFAATLSTEHPELHPVRVDLGGPVDDRGGDAGDDPGDEEAAALARECQGDGQEDAVALRGSQRFAARLRQTPPEPAAPPSPRAAREGESYRLEIPNPGVLDRLTLREASRRAPGPGEVEIRVKAGGLNFLDVMKAMGVYPGLDPAAPVALGGECAGTVTAVGDGVAHPGLGDEVLAITPSFDRTSLLSAYVTVPAALTLPRPSRVSALQAAAFPLAFLTAHYALHHLAHLEAGERVLIHSATGGVGLAAVQLAQKAGAEVFATAGTSEKRARLRELGVRHVMDSRSLSFAAEVLEQTNGEGVDVVLNSLAGEAIPRSLELLRPYGRFLEIGKRDIYQNRQIGLLPFRNNLSYFAIDLARAIEQRGRVVETLLRELGQRLSAGELDPLPVTAFPASDATSAFRTLAMAQHIGKLVLSFEEPEPRIVSAAAGAVSSEARYLITGGLGALGLVVAGWMVERGARHLVLVGRSEPSAEARAAIAKLEAAGAEVEVTRADLTRPEDVTRLVSEVRRSAAPLRGVVHAAGLLADATLAEMTPAQLRAPMAPKVEGSFNLHAATLDDPLDFFVLFSSAAGVLGTAGQANYAAGNAFLDALAQHRNALGRPALSIAWGPWAEVGLAAAEANRGARLDAMGLGSITPREARTILDRLLGARGQMVVIPFDYGRWRAQVPTAAKGSLFREWEQRAGAPGSAVPVARESLRTRLEEAPPGRPRRTLLEGHVQEQVASVLRLATTAVSLNKPFRSLGLDSLMALELRNRLEASLGLSIPATTFFNYSTVATLVPHLAKKLDLPLEFEEAAATATEGPDLEKMLAEIEQLSAEEARKLLEG